MDLNLSLNKQAMGAYIGPFCVGKVKKVTNSVKLVDYTNLDEIKYGMYLATSEAGAKAYFNKLPIDVAGKTGTAQREGKIPPVDEVEYLIKHLQSF